MKANEVALNDFLSQTKTQFVIPVYQRNYDWTEEQCKQLLYDILEIGNKTEGVHFIGSIVFIHDGVYTSSEVKQLVVIDGQQRLTTFSLLYLALHRFAQENDMQEKADEIKDTFITNKYVKEEGSKMKLKQSDNNASAFKFLMSGEDVKEYKEFSRVINNFSYFKQNISAPTFETILNGLNRLIFVEISLERGKDDPQRIFESINSTGLELSQADLIRNYILMGLEPRDQERIFESYWNVIENKTKHIDTEQRRVSDFIRDFLTYKTKKIPNRNAVYEEFKSRYANRDNRFYEETLQEIKEYSYYYDKLINWKNEDDENVRKELEYLNRLEIQVAFPFLLPVYNDYSKNVISKDVFISVLRLVQSYTWRRIMINMPASALNKIFLTLYNDIQPHNYLESLQRSLVKKKGTSRIPNDQEIDSALAERDVYTMQAKNRIYFFEQLENYQNREYVSIDNPNLTIEHIFPQNPSQKWEEELSEQEFTTFQEKYLNTIGNLTLSGNNGSLSNKSFQEKKHMNTQGKEQGYLFSNLRMNAMLKEIDVWDEENYLKRLAWIQERFKKIWPYPEVELASENDEEDEDYSIFEVTDARFKKLDYFIFRDEKVVTKEIAGMYQHVINILYHENPVLFGHPDIASIIQLTADRNSLRYAKELGSTFFYESNIDNNNKLERLRRLLIRFNSEDDLLLNFSNRSDDNEQVHVDRSYWESKANSDALNIMDGCFQLFKEIDPGMSLNYVQTYVGLLKNGKAYNCTLFQPTSSYVRTKVYVENPSNWIAQLQNAGVSSNVALGKNGRIRIRISKENFTFHRELLRKLFEASYNRWSEE